MELESPLSVGRNIFYFTCPNPIINQGYARTLSLREIFVESNEKFLKPLRYQRLDIGMSNLIRVIPNNLVAQ